MAIHEWLITTDSFCNRETVGNQFDFLHVSVPEVNGRECSNPIHTEYLSANPDTFISEINEVCIN